MIRRHRPFLVPGSWCRPCVLRGPWCAYDLVFRHALDVDEAGSRLAFGSTTGSLWVSEDRGDSWTTVSSNLPPIYSVRFEKPTR
jgi:hypothetical protein